MQADLPGRDHGYARSLGRRRLLDQCRIYQGNGAQRVRAHFRYGNHSWETERSYDLDSRVRGEYVLFQELRFAGIFTVGADTNFTASPTVSLYGNLYFFGDFNGQLANRLIGVPSGPPPVTDPIIRFRRQPLFRVSLGFGGHTIRLNGQVGASIRSSERSTISLSAGAQHGWYTGNSASITPPITAVSAIPFRCPSGPQLALRFT